MRIIAGSVVLVLVGCKNDVDPVDTDVADTDTDVADTDTDTCADDAQEPNDALDDAMASTGGAGLVVCSTSDDWWVVTVPDGYNLTAEVTFVNDDGDIDAWLYDSAGSVLDVSQGVSDSEIVLWTNGEGAETDVFLEISLFGGDRNTYDLAIDVSAP
ncbi:MAG: hypothetical protein H6737_07585 [Alphaproteobacteria bacterium]|nr:hypothetical protein [Alphaproteobacteria bacterium]